MTSQNVYIYNNIVANNTGGYGMYRDDTGWNYIYTVSLGANCTYQNTPSNYGWTNSQRPLDYTGDHFGEDPELSSDRCHLASGSQCTNWGITNASGNVTYLGPYDIDTQARIADSLIDVGCDEVQ